LISFRSGIHLVDKRHSFVFDLFFNNSGICISFPNILGKMLRFQNIGHINGRAFVNQVYFRRVELFPYKNEREEDEVPADVNGTHFVLGLILHDAGFLNDNKALCRRGRRWRC